MEKTLYEFEPFSQDGEINVVVETTRDSGSKFKYEPELGQVVLERSLPKGLEFPFDFGFVPSTLGDDGDPLDALVLLDSAVFPGCMVKARLIGVIEATQKKGKERLRNDRLVAVQANSVTWNDVRELDELPRGLIEQFGHFFRSYHEVQGTPFKVIAQRGARHAKKLVEQGIKRFRKSKKATPEQAHKYP